MDIERILFYIVFLIITFSMINYFNTKNKLTKYKIIIDANVSKDDIVILDNIIADSFREYIILNEAYKELDYINSEHEEKICKELSNIVSKRISEALFERLSLYYNKKELPYIIGNKIYLTVMQYTMEYNNANKK